MCVKSRSEAYGITLFCTQFVANVGSVASACKSSFRVPRITEIADFSSAFNTSGFGSKIRIFCMFFDFKKLKTWSGGGRLLPKNP